jgi:hypothetical protein
MNLAEKFYEIAYKSFNLIVIGHFITGLISLLWLILINNTYPIFAGIVFLIIGPWFLGLLILPTNIFVFLNDFFVTRIKNNNMLKLPLLYLVDVLASIYVYSLITIWCFWGLDLYYRTMTQTNSIPLLLWTYSITLAPYLYAQYIAEKEEFEETGSHLPVPPTLFFAEISFIFIVLSIITFRINIFYLFIFFIFIMLFPFIIELHNIFLSRKAQLQME